MEFGSSYFLCVAYYCGCVMKSKYRIIDVDSELVVMDRFNLSLFSYRYLNDDDRLRGYDLCFKFIDRISDPKW